MYNGPVFAANFFILSFLMVTTAISIMLWTARLFIPSIRDDLVRRIFEEYNYKHAITHKHKEQVDG